MVDSERTSPQDIQEDTRHDGQIELGSHTDRLSELTGQPVPERIPVSFFELQDGQVTREQIRVLGFFVQEYLNVISAPLSKEPLFQRAVEKILSSEAASFYTRFVEMTKTLQQLLDRADHFTGEAEELMEVLDRVAAQIQEGEVPLVSPEERTQLLTQCMRQQAELQAEADDLETKKSTPEGLTEEDKQRRQMLGARLNELTPLINYYKVFTREELQEEVDNLIEDQKDLAQKVADGYGPKYAERLADTRRDLEITRQRLENYEAYVQEQQTAPIPSAETTDFLSFHTTLRKEITRFKGSTQPGARPGTRARVVDLLSLPQAQKALAEA
ncbi:hypothetical protein H3C70_05600 [Patescibacteria group bacterium]|nr:hypothetical protein [Patescibacteria group bacterium]